ncbi:hypothetical protein WJX82_003655 [Trebouxia sp. C0006]
MSSAVMTVKDWQRYEVLVPSHRQARSAPGRSYKQKKSQVEALPSLASRLSYGKTAAASFSTLPPLCPPVELLPSPDTDQRAHNTRPLQATESSGSIIPEAAWQSRCQALKNELLAVSHRTEQELQDRDFMLEKLRQTCNGQREFITRQAEQIRDLTRSLQDVSISSQRQIRAVDVAHRAAEKDASVWQKQMELSQLQHQKQIQTVKARCRLLQAERDALTMALSAVAFELMGGSNASAADVKQSLEGAINAGEEPLHRSKTCWLQLKYAVDDEGSVSNPYHGDGARAVQVLLKQAARVVQQRKEADDRACQAAALVSKRDDVIESFTQEHRTLVQLAEQFESTAVKVQQRRAIAGFMVQNPDNKSLVQRLAVVDHMLTRFNKELGYQQSQIKKLQAQNTELQFYSKLHQGNTLSQ